MQAVTKSRKRFRSLLRRANDAAAVKDKDLAARLYAEYLTHVPNDAKVLFNMGTLRQQAANHAPDSDTMRSICIEAMTFYAKAIESPEADIETKADCLNNHGLIMVKLGFPDKAKIAFFAALQLNPELRAARLNFADVLVFEGEYDEADRQFFEVINSDPNSAGAHFCRSMLLLMEGELRRGFRDYRARFSVKTFPSKIMETDRSMWDGEDLNGKTLILTTEQGHGDQVQFIRYAGRIKDRWPASKVYFSGADCMHKLFAGVDGLDGCLPDHLTPEFKALNPDFDFHIPLMHLPDVMGTTLATVPNKCPYIKPHPTWNQFTIPPSEKFKVGIVWAGSPRHGKDKFRSIEPEAFQPMIGAHPEIQFYSLQCGPRCAEVLRLNNVISLAETIHDWTDTAQAILALDMVITVDTAVAHLAGALGKPVWILIGASPDWRWMLNREDSPWYPQTRLYRQPTRGDWQTPLSRISQAL